MEMNILQKTADETRESLERWCDEHDGDMVDFFVDSIYGEDADGGLIVGYGVYGSANIVVDANHATCGGHSSSRFSERLTKAMTEFMDMLENC